MFGDQGVTTSAARVLELIRNENAAATILAGDIGYSASVEDWKDQLAVQFNASYPYFIAMGNHDWCVQLISFSHFLWC
jgi:hypothetical protein